MARLHDRVIDCARPAATARFWAALDDCVVAPYDDAAPARLRAQGISGPGEDDPTVLVAPRDVGPRLWCQLVPEPRRVKNRLHLHLVSNDPESELARLTALGVTVPARPEDTGCRPTPRATSSGCLPARLERPADRPDAHVSARRTDAAQTRASSAAPNDTSKRSHQMLTLL